MAEYVNQWGPYKEHSIIYGVNVKHFTVTATKEVK